MREDGNRRGEKPDTSGWEAMPLCLPLLLIQACVSRSFSQNRCSLHFSSLPYSYPSRSTSLSHTQANSIGKPKNPKVGQGHGEKSTLEMDMGKSRQGKAGIVLWMRRPITSKSLGLVLVLSAYRLSRITGGQMSLVTLANCCQLNLEKGHLAASLPLILDHCRLQLMNHQMNFLQYRAAQRILYVFTRIFVL
ncbi:uncharacterized protein LOC126596047 isoform X4 [Malus sylvestris]|uniref:uncharacterized protein LOC126596047 isoform X4 n=1 Tax=Malus sylvestris TaxID=3752 RepID=UPI0021AD43EB|nr:uncharacterized protein LOC126596047 isoform X4 [Malus sylvestris]